MSTPPLTLSAAMNVATVPDAGCAWIATTWMFAEFAFFTAGTIALLSIESTPIASTFAPT
jgi:hypothetical protein